jgi:hypothetical protein
MKHLLFVVVIFPFIAISQNSDFGNWMIFLGNKEFKEKFNWHSELQYRNYNAIGDLEQLLVRTGVGMNLTEKNNNVLQGYAYVRGENYDETNLQKKVSEEHRLFQQFLTRQTFGRINFQHRYRFEQRFLKDDFRMRLRYFLAFQVPINNKKMIDKTSYFSAYNEIFINTENEFYDRNRFYLGAGYKFNNVFRVEVGYMNQVLMDFNRDQLNVFAYISI